MELKDFVKATLEEIIQGVKDAQESTKDSGAIINPKELAVGNHGDKYMKAGGWSYATDIEINVSVNIQEKEGNKTAIGVFSGFISGGGAVTNDNESTALSSVKFVIPVVLPTSKIPEGTSSGGQKWHIPK